MLCVHIIFEHISSILFFSLSLLPLKFSCLLPSNEWFFLYCTLFLNIYNFCFLLTPDCFVRSWTFQKNLLLSYFYVQFLWRVPRRVWGFGSYCGWLFWASPWSLSRETWELHAHHHCTERSLRRSVQRLVSWTGKGWHGNNISRPVSTHLVKLYTFHGP